jgi:hypothetical protein
MQLTRELGPYTIPGQLDIPATAALGGFQRGVAVFVRKQIYFDTLDAMYTAYVISQVIAVAEHALHEIANVSHGCRSGPLLEANPLLRGLSVRLDDRLTLLRKAIRERPELARLIPLKPRDASEWHLIGYGVRYQSSLAARRLHEYLRYGVSSAEHGTQYIESARTVVERLYEFWCFCEVTRRLAELRRFDIMQYSLLRRGLDKPVFVFGDGGYVYYEHRCNYFALHSGHTIPLNKEHPRRGPEWVIVRMCERREVIILDCKYYSAYRSGMFDPIYNYCANYAAEVGVGLSPIALRGRVHRKGNPTKVSEFLHVGRPGNRSLKIIEVCFKPSPEFEQLNRDIVDHLLEQLGLV